MNIRLATMADLPRLAVINAQGYPGEEERALRELPAFVHPGHTLCLEAEGELRGLLYWNVFEGNVWELTQVTVQDGFRQKGLGTRLVEEFLNLARSRRVGKVVADVRPENAASRKLLAKFGGKEVGEVEPEPGKRLILIEFNLA